MQTMRRRAKSLVLPMFRRVRPVYAKLADTLVNDIRAKSLVPPREPGGNWVEFSGKNEKKDHEGFVSFLGSDNFETLMTELKVTERITGIETISG